MSLWKVPWDMEMTKHLRPSILSSQTGNDKHTRKHSKDPRFAEANVKARITV